ncbi:nucleotidyl transferase AbiEii/AbiGii toxin family protein [Deinococcus frigens]|uniref:nucleotidyl transferase AbiEii/AbiGii toxin family protein n=1 Tax=Deinococcus frigens TaxID=249403 RepID=UPI0004968128|nr:nucleotidyl transferase AbiEii/AbiGii toxin family protein [Deinococcus frigens]
MTAPKVGRRWHDLDPDTQRAALARAQAQTGRDSVILEKDIWVVWALNALFSTCALAPDQKPTAGRARMVFKGGTSLSKAYGHINRFSEDIDVTLELQAHDGRTPEEIRTTSRSRRDAYRDEYLSLCLNFIEGSILPALQRQAELEGAPLRLRLDTADEATPSVWMTYPSVTSAGLDYIQKAVKFEFGARNVITPAHQQQVTTYIAKVAEIAAAVDLPVALPNVLAAERTFLEKATALHVLCRRGSTLEPDVLDRKTHRFARHLDDLCRLADQGVAALALADQGLVQDVVDTKEAFFKEGGISYHEVLQGQTQLVPEGRLREVLEKDYRQMQTAGMLGDSRVPFAELLAQLQTLQDQMRLLGS